MIKSKKEKLYDHLCIQERHLENPAATAKILRKLKIEEKCFNLIKSIYKKATSYLIEILNNFN